MTTFRVDDYAGTDSQRLAAACTAALKAMPSTVVMPSRELVLTTPNQKVRPGVSVLGDPIGGTRILLDYPGAAAPSDDAPAGLIIQGGPTTLTGGSVIGGFEIESRGEGYYRLLAAQAVSGGVVRDPQFRDLVFGICGQSFISLRDVIDTLGRPVVHTVVGRYGGDNSYDGVSAKYKIAVNKSPGVILDGLDLGDPTHDRNQSFVTLNASPGAIVRNFKLYGTRTYCLNTHGQGSDGAIFEDGTITPTPGAHFGGILVGNEAWGADLDVILRRITMIGPGRFLQLRSKEGGPTSTAWLYGNTVPPCNELVGFGPGGGVAHHTEGAA